MKSFQLVGPSAEVFAPLFAMSDAQLAARGARRVVAVMEPGEIPEYVRSRLMSVRVYDSAHCMIDAAVCEGREARSAILTLFENVGARYIHLHNAKQGCYSCAVNRV